MSWGVLVAVVLFAGCVRRIPVERAELPRLARYRQTGELLLIRDNRIIEVRSPQRPVLVTSRARIPLQQLRPADLVGVDRAELLIGDGDDGWRPRGAVGFEVAGPIGIGGLGAHWYPIDAVAVEAALLPAADLGAAQLGLRLRPWRIATRALPFIGGFAHVGAAMDLETGQSKRWAAAGGRLGLEVEAGHTRRWLLGAELDLVHPLVGDAWVGNEQAHWFPWGGGHIAYQF
jgi:hypothetical protein